MTTNNRDCGIVALVIDLLDGNTTPARAACGLPTPFLLLFGLVYKLGRLDRGETVSFDAVECHLLEDILVAACELERSGQQPTLSDEVVAAMIKRVAFDNAEPADWGWRLFDARLRGKGWKVSRAQGWREEQ